MSGVCPVSVRLAGADVQRRRLLGYSLLLGVGAARLMVDALNAIEISARAGVPYSSWAIWTAETTSFVAWLLLLPFLIVSAAELRPPKLSPARTSAAHVLLSLPFILGQLSLSVLLRKIAYGLSGGWYRFELSSDLLFELRQSALDYLILVLVVALVEHFARQAGETAQPAPVPAALPRIEVGTRTSMIWLRPDEIDWVEAAGNYVELHTKNGDHLHRATLATMEQMLSPHGFVRIHRCRIVRQEAVREISVKQSGHFTILTEGGAELAGSRRYRESLQGDTRFAASAP